MTGQNLFDLSGTVAWVVGGAGLLGSECSRALAQHGAHVAISGRSEESAQLQAESLRDEGLSAEALRLDARDSIQVENTASQLADRHGRLDTLVNLAFGSSGASLDDITAEQWEAGLRDSSTSAMLVSRAAARHMTSGGSIVQVASMYGMVAPDPANYPDGIAVNPPDYGFAKAGLIQFVRYQAVHLGQRGIRVNAITPGPFPGPAARTSSEFVDRLSERTPLGRVGEPFEIGGPVVFLASQASSYVTGANLVVDGGWTAW
jgi:NAD(P)-dependent dehydrogenase (short-subunit alcohol dehydrogenase family)